MGKVIVFSYTGREVFNEVQQISQYNARLNKDKEGNINLDVAFSEDQMEYFNSYCKDAANSISMPFLKVNYRDLESYSFVALTENYVGIVKVSVTDYGYVKNHTLNTLDGTIKTGIIHFIVGMWYSHIGLQELSNEYRKSFEESLLKINYAMMQLLRKQYIPVWGIKATWSDFVCEQSESYVMTLQWSDFICEQGLMAIAYEEEPNSTN